MNMFPKSVQLDLKCVELDLKCIEFRSKILRIKSIKCIQLNLNVKLEN